MSERITVFFDLETGGLADTHPDIQLAAVAVDEATWKELRSFEAKIRFNEAAADPAALKMNHYDPAVWAERAKPESRVVAEFAEFLNCFRALTLTSKRTGRPYSVARLAGYNAATFDGPRLRRMFERAGAFAPWDPRVRCTLQRTLAWFDEHGIALESYRLEPVCQYFGIPVEETHDALVDVKLTIQLARRLRDARVPAEVAAAS